MAHVDPQSSNRSAFLLQPGKPPITVGQLFSGVSRFIYTHNPLYAASASMVFWGLRASFSTADGTLSSGLLTICLAGYILLLAVTACLVIRLGKVWDDARSLLLLVVLMFVGLSVTFDGVLVARPGLGAAYCVGGWVFAALVSEILLRSIHLRLGLWLRLPYHGSLALFFLYPLVLNPWLSQPEGPTLQWLLFGFASAGAAIFLTSLPAARRGAGYIEGNGSPWSWPLFPWTLFAVLGLCVSLRAYYLCLSFHFVGYADSIFGPYFLAPLGFVAALLLLEGGIAGNSARARRAALWLPAAMVALCAIGHRHDQVYRGFLVLFERACGGSPLWVALLLAIGFYGFAAVRHVRGALAALSGAMLLLAFVAPTSLDFDHLGPIRPLPLAILGVVHLHVGLWRRVSWQVLLGNGLVLAALALAFRGTWFTALHGALPIHLALASLLAIRLWFDDWFSRVALRLAAVLVLALVYAVVFARPGWLGEFDVWIRALHPVLLTGAMAWAAWPLGDRWVRGLAGVTLLLWGAVSACRGYELLRPYLIGLDQLALGVLFFVVAVLISSRKAGWLRLPPRRSAEPPPPPAVDVATPDWP